ncbi:MAG: low temperature requirement protein A [Frankiaceae bacterium]
MLTALPVSAAAVVLVIGGALGPPYQTALWAFALLVDYVGIWVAGSAGWRLPSPVHFAERFGLIVIVALGESLVAIGVWVSGQPVSVPVITASILGVDPRRQPVVAVLRRRRACCRRRAGPYRGRGAHPAGP